MALAAAAVALMGAASPTPDLSAYLAPVTSDWIEESPAPDVMDGPFTAHEYGQFVQDSSTEQTLNRYGFIAGYARAWEQKVTQDYLDERVFEFASSNGPGYTLSWFKQGAQTSKYFKRNLTALPQTNSFGVEEDYASNAVSFRYYFVKANLFFVIHLQTASGKDLSDTARGIAQTEFDGAPDASTAGTITLTGVSSITPLVVGGIFASVIIVVALVSVIVAVALAQRRGRPPQATGAGIRMSPDGRYWWDGYRWRDTATDPPPRIG